MAVKNKSVKKSKKVAQLKGLDNWGKEQVSLLNQMKDAINKYGWVQGEEGSEEGGFCLIGAKYHIERKTGKNIEGGIINYALDKYLDWGVDNSHDAYVQFNDEEGRTKKDIIKALDKSIVAVKDFVKARQIKTKANEVAAKREALEEEIRKLAQESDDFINGYGFDNEEEFRVDVDAYLESY